MTKLGGRNRSRIAIVDGVVMVVPKVVKVGGGGIVLREGEWIAMLRVGAVIVVDVISKATVIEAILPGGRGAPCGGREGEARVIMRG